MKVVDAVALINRTVAPVAGAALIAVASTVSLANAADGEQSANGSNTEGAPVHASMSASKAKGAGDELAVATFAGGCFWCMEPPYDRLQGVVSTISGYMGGHVEDPTYKQVSSGKSGHIEVLQVTYHPSQVSYETLLNVFWRNVDPFDAGGQFCDRGEQYSTGIFAHTPEQQQLAASSKAALNVGGRFDESIITPVKSASTFYPAEDYHQDYYQLNPVRYKYYRWRCGRDQRLEDVWGDEAGGKSEPVS